MQFTPYKFWSFPLSFLFESSWQQQLGNLYSVMRREEPEPSSLKWFKEMAEHAWFTLAVIQFF